MELPVLRMAALHGYLSWGHGGCRKCSSIHVLSGCMKELCDEIVEHIFNVTRGEDNKEGVNVTQMVLHLKVDTKERIWILWSSSIRVSAEGSGNIAGAADRVTTSKVNYCNLM